MIALLESEKERLVAMRRELHAHPELSRQEEWTSAFVAERLRAEGVALHERVGGYGLVGVIEGSAPGPAVALRADMDALEITEITGLPYASRNAGRMHACGHDGHMAILIGAGMALARRRDFPGTVHLVFQPAEERYGGAKLMVEAGLFERFPSRQIFGLHNWPGLPAGEVLVHDGPVMAGTSEFYVRFLAEGSHAAMPHLSGDPLLAGGHFMTGLQQAVARAIDPFESAVATVGSFQGGHAQNIIPQEAVLAGTLRAFRMETLTVLRERVLAVAAAAAAMGNCRFDVEFDETLSPPVINTPAERDIMREAIGLAGLTAFGGEGRPSMVGEDFGEFLLHRPGCYAWLGNGPARPEGRLHQPAYDFNDEILVPGAALLARAAERALQTA